MSSRFDEWAEAARELQAAYPHVDDAMVLWFIRQYDGGTPNTIEESARAIRQRRLLGEYARTGRG